MEIVHRTGAGALTLLTDMLQDRRPLVRQHAIDLLVDLAPVFKGHEGREPTGWFSPNPSRVACTDIHPNAEGHDAITRAIMQAR